MRYAWAGEHVRHLEQRLEEVVTVRDHCARSEPQQLLRAAVRADPDDAPRDRLCETTGRTPPQEVGDRFARLSAWLEAQVLPVVTDDADDSVADEPVGEQFDESRVECSERAV